VKPTDHAQSNAFGLLLGAVDYPMFVVTAAAGGQRAGCLVGFTTQVSIEPRRFLAALSDKNRSFRVALRADRLAVHAIAAAERSLVRLFGEQTGDLVDKFAQCDWHEGPGGVPILDRAAAWFSGAVVQRVPFGDHTGFVIEPDAGECRSAAGGLISFADVRDLDPGHDA
jgi:flavin reductase (DIM6/NTAB) family NADH-FMN oxidoreductase RutF